MKADRPRKISYGRSRWKPNCSVCQMMKKNTQFRFKIFNSSYFNPESTRGPMRVNKEYGNPFSYGNLYRCLKVHHGAQLINPTVQVVDGHLVIDNRLKPAYEIVEGIPPGSVTNHELGLDDFIAKGREKLARGELQITASTFLTAIKTKMDNDAKTKDRRADMLQGLFKGAAPKAIDDV